MVRLLGLSPGGLASQKIWQSGLEGQGYTLGSCLFLPFLGAKPYSCSISLWPVGIASHSSYESGFFYSGIEKRGGSRRGYSEGASKSLVSAHTLYVWGPIVLVLLAFSR